MFVNLECLSLKEASFCRKYGSRKINMASCFSVGYLNLSNAVSEICCRKIKMESEVWVSSFPQLKQDAVSDYMSQNVAKC